MGREVKRVPLDFDWPVGKTWSGFLMPDHLHFPPCTDCGGTGYSPSARAVSETFYGYQIDGPNGRRLAWHDKIGQAEVDHLLAKGRLSTWIDGKWRQIPLTAAEVNARNSAGGMDTHDGINRVILIRFRCERLGIDLNCEKCDGQGDIATEALRAEQDAWTPEEPPAGEGFQMWENTSEGSAISPVFANPDALAHWLADNNASALGSSGATFEQWRAMIGDGDALSMVVVDGKVMSGVEYAARDA